MRDKIDELLTAYDEKRISRRQLIGALLMVSATGARVAGAGQQKPAVNLTGTPPPANALFRGRIVNHVTLRVKDVGESRRFYQELLGASVLLDGRTSEGAGAIDLLVGDSFVTVSGGRGRLPSITLRSGSIRGQARTVRSRWCRSVFRRANPEPIRIGSRKLPRSEA